MNVVSGNSKERVAHHPAEKAESARLQALRNTGLLDSPPEKVFERLTELTCRALRVPVALVSLVDADRQFFKSSCGLPEPWASRRETPLSHSFCQHVVASGEPLVIPDARQHPLVRDNLAVGDLAVSAYLGIPLLTPDGHAIGSLCAINSAPRQWSDDDIVVLSGLAELAATEIALRPSLREREMLLRRSRRYADQLQALAQASLRISPLTKS